MQGLQTWFETDAPSDVQVLNVLVQDAQANPATVERAAEWAEYHEVDFLVLADADQSWVSVWGDMGGGRFNQHSYTVVDSQGLISWRAEGYSPTSAEEIADAVDSAP